MQDGHTSAIHSDSEVGASQILARMLAAKLCAWTIICSVLILVISKMEVTLEAFKAAVLLTAFLTGVGMWYFLMLLIIFTYTGTSVLVVTTIVFTYTGIPGNTRGWIHKAHGT